MKTITKEIIQKCFDAIKLPVKIRSLRLGDGFYVYSKYAVFDGKEFISNDIDGESLLKQCVCSFATRRDAAENRVDIDRSKFPNEYIEKANANYDAVKKNTLAAIDSVLNPVSNVHPVFQNLIYAISKPTLS